MIWTLIVIFLFVISIISNKLYRWKHRKVYENINTVSVLGSICGAVVLIIVFSINNVAVNYSIQENQIEYEGLIKRLEVINSDFEDVSKSDVIKDISEWNKKVYFSKYWTENIWTNWLCNKKYADTLQYIEIKIE